MRRIFSDVGYMGLSQLIIAIGQLALQMYVVRNTTLHEYGEFIGSQVIVTVIESIFVARGGELALRYVGPCWTKGDYLSARLFSKAIIRIDKYLNWILCILLACLAFIASSSLNLNPSYLLLLSLTIPAQIGYGLYKSLFIVSSRLRQQSLFEINFAAIQITTGIIGVLTLGIYGLIISTVITAFAKTLIARKITEKWWPGESTEDSHLHKDVDIKNWWRDSIHSVVRNSFFSGSNQIDIILLNAFRGSETVALYKIAKTLSSIPIRLAAPIWSALRPRMLHSWNRGDRKKIVKLILIPASLMLCFLPVMLVLSWLYGREFIIHVYGSEYALAITPFFFLLVGAWIFNVSTGWYRFWILIVKERLSSTNISGLQFFMLLALGISYGSHSIQSMAQVIAVSMTLISLICWYELFRKLRRL